MSEAAVRRDDDAPGTPAVLGAATLGRAMAQSVIAESGPLGGGTAAFARAWSLEADRLTVELFYLSLLTTRFAIEVGLPAPSSGEVQAAFEHALLASAGDRVNEAGLKARMREYRDAFGDPHPELGTGVFDRTDVCTALPLGPRSRRHRVRGACLHRTAGRAAQAAVRGYRRLGGDSRLMIASATTLAGLRTATTSS